MFTIFNTMKQELINKVKEEYTELFSNLTSDQYYFEDDKFHLNVDEWGDGKTTFDFDVNEDGKLFLDDKHCIHTWCSGYDSLTDAFSSYWCKEYSDYPSEVLTCDIRTSIFNKYVTNKEYPISPGNRAKVIGELYKYLFSNHNILIIKYKDSDYSKYVKNLPNDRCDPFLIKSGYDIKDNCICFNDFGKERIISLDRLDGMLFVDKADYTPDLNLKLDIFKVENEISDALNEIMNRYK
jgi:hypothetical protein